MDSPKISVALLLASIPAAFAVGSARVVNKCGTPVYFASVAQGVHSEMQPLPANGYSEVYNKANVGVSIKLAPSLNSAVTQFEFTWASPNINYDISNIDGNPFAKQGMSLAPSMSGAAGFPTCVTVECPAGQDRCDAAYNMPDDVRTMVCPENSDLIFTLCPGGAAAASAPAPAPAAAGSAENSAPAAQNKVVASSKGQSQAGPSAAQGDFGAAITSKAGNVAQRPSAAPAASSSPRGNRQHTRRGHVHQFD